MSPSCDRGAAQTDMQAPGGGMDCIDGLVLGHNYREVRVATAAQNWLICIHRGQATRDPNRSKYSALYG
jgi:hypothetical protein